MCSHVPNKGEQMVRYYGYYSNVSRGKRKIQDKDDAIPSIPEPDGSSREFRKNWARLIQKIYEIDPLKYLFYDVEYPVEDSEISVEVSIT